MGKKGSLFSAIKRALSPQSKEKLGNEAERKSGKEKRKKLSSLFIPIFREPSSIEKILAETERDHNLIFRPPTPDHRSNPPSASPPLRPASPRVTSPQAASPQSPLLRPTSPRVVSPQEDSKKPPSPRQTSPKVASPQDVPPKPSTPREDPLRLETPRLPSPKTSSRVEPSTLNAPRTTTPPKPPSPRAILPLEIVSRPEPTLLVQHASATKIQAAFRGYTARRSYKALRGLVRLPRGGERIQREGADSKCNEVHAETGPCSIQNSVTPHKNTGKPNTMQQLPLASPSPFGLNFEVELTRRSGNDIEEKGLHTNFIQDLMFE